jgi:preprotein translocase subunit YajC
MLFISSAYAQEAAAAAGEPSMTAGLLPLVLIFVVFYFLLIRPQQKKFKQHQEMVNSIAKGDKIVTSGGVIGTVTKVDAENDIATVEVSEGVKIKVVRSTIASVLNAKPEAGNDNKKDAKAA